MSFVDTNVLVYSTASTAPFRDAARNALVRFWVDASLAISRQVLREYIAVMTREQAWDRPLTLAEAREDVTQFMRRFAILENSPDVWDRLMDLSRTHGFSGRQVHDANIVATMLAHGERRILTFNASDFRRFADLIEIASLSAP